MDDNKVYAYVCDLCGKLVHKSQTECPRCGYKIPVYKESKDKDEEANKNGCSYTR